MYAFPLLIRPAQRRVFFHCKQKVIVMTYIELQGGGNVSDDWPELEQDQRNDRADDPDADPNVADDDEPRPGVPASDPESGA